MTGRARNRGDVRPKVRVLKIGAHWHWACPLHGYREWPEAYGVCWDWHAALDAADAHARQAHT